MNRIKRPVLFLLLSTIVLILSGFIEDNTSFSQQQPPDKKADNCITTQCHSGIEKGNFLHGPVAVKQCTVCHGESKGHENSPARNKFKPIKDIAAQCFSCHEKFKLKNIVHDPVQRGACTDCHDPHGSSFKYQLIAQGSSLCFSCHDEALVSKEFIHGPAAAGACLACHDPHSADYEKNLRAKGPKLCFMCHAELASSFLEAKIIHKPVAEDCVKCHNPHSESKKFMLAKEAPSLCFGCHTEKKEWVSSASVQHGALITGKSCLNCHEPHVSNIAKRLSMAPMDLCLSCHDKEVETPDGKLLTNMKNLLAYNKDHHGPIKQRDCSGCHNPHGSENFRILREQYPEKFYMPFDMENYNLCFKCHEKAIVQTAETVELTDFRNGKLNLHFKHVNQADKGRTCRACHETHASNHPKHVRDSVPFGTWELPINYQKTASGGSCAPGCHKPKQYDRINKLENP